MTFLADFVSWYSLLLALYVIARLWVRVRETEASVWVLEGLLEQRAAVDVSAGDRPTLIRGIGGAR